MQVKSDFPEHAEKLSPGYESKGRTLVHLGETNETFRLDFGWISDEIGLRHTISMIDPKSGFSGAIRLGCKLVPLMDLRDPRSIGREDLQTVILVLDVSERLIGLITECGPMLDQEPRETDPLRAAQQELLRNLFAVPMRDDKVLLVYA